jgi:AcrR family transcriptional regulator
LKKSDGKADLAPTKSGQTREKVVERALQIAAEGGLDALSIGRLAQELKMSKSGLFTFRIQRKTGVGGN